MTSKSNADQRTKRKGTTKRAVKTTPQEMLDQIKQIILSCFILAVAVITNNQGTIVILPDYPLVAATLHGAFILVAFINTYNRIMIFIKE